jgi:hypothetical protein
MDRSARSYRRAAWLTAGLLLALVLGLVGYELIWLRQRALAWARSWERMMTVDESFSASKNLPARGPGRLDKLVMQLLGEPEREFLSVSQPEIQADLLATFKDHHLSDDVLEGLPEVKRAHWLFPEAIIVVTYHAPKARADR